MIIDLQYLPSLEYFCALLAHDEIIIEAHEFFEKQSYRNRCRIQTTNKIDTLTVPVQHGNSKVLIKDLRIDIIKIGLAVTGELFILPTAKALFLNFIQIILKY